MKQYPEYKDSGIEWIGQIPIDWEIKQLRLLASNEKYSFVDGPFGSDLKNEEYVDSGVPLIQLNNIGIGRHNTKNLRFITIEKSRELYKHKVFPEEIVIAKMADPVARAALVSPEYDSYTIVADCVKLKPNGKIVDSEFIVYSLNSASVRFNAELYSGGTTRLRINLSALKKLRLLFPSLNEQVHISRYLNLKTYEIDSLIGKKQKLIELLQEERTALINQAVTKGLNPDVPMKDSGIEWLGEIPEHWKIQKICNLVKVKDGTHDTPKPVLIAEDTVPLVTSKNVKDDTIDFESTYHISKQDYLAINMRSDVKLGDIIMPMIGTVGNPVIVKTNKPFSIKNLALFKKSDKIDNRYLRYLLMSNFINTQFDLIQKGGVQSFVSLEILRGLRITYPPLSEQRSIADRLDHENQLYVTAKNKIIDQINLFIEYKTTLINEAVTGKIDVRDYQINNG